MKACEFFVAINSDDLLFKHSETTLIEKSSRLFLRIVFHNSWAERIIFHLLRSDETKRNQIIKSSIEFHRVYLKVFC